MSQSHELRILLSDDSAGATNPISIAAMGTDLIGDQEWGEDLGRRGTRQEYSCGARVLREVVAGGFELQPTAAQLDWFLQRGLGDAISTFPAAPVTPGETLPQFYVHVDKGPRNFRYEKVVIARLGLSVRESDYLKLRVDLVGSTEVSDVAWPGSPPAIACASEYVCSDAVFNLAASPYKFKSIDLSIDNQIADGQHENALLRTVFESEGLAIGLNALFAYRSDTLALYRRAVAGDVGSLVFADGTTTYTFAFPNLKVPGKGPLVPARGEITQNISMRAKRTVADPQITVTKS
jgi:hypothetical protein